MRNANPCIHIVAGEVLPITLSHRNIYLSFVDINYSFFQGPETESSAVIHDGNKVVVFIGNERPGSISIYSFHGDMTRATFESIYWDIPNTAETWQQSFDQRSITAIDPEDIRYSVKDVWFSKLGLEIKKCILCGI